MSLTYCNKSECLDVLCNEISQLFTSANFSVKVLCLLVNCDFFRMVDSTYY